MQLSNLFRDDDAVSSTLGVVLLVSVTVILAAIFGAFAFGFLGTESAPNTEFNYDFNGSGGVVVSHDGGNALDGDRLQFGEGWGTNSTNTCGFVSGETTSGDVVIDQDGDGDGDPCAHGAGPGTDLSLVWESNDGKTFTVDERSRSG